MTPTSRGSKGPGVSKWTWSRTLDRLTSRVQDMYENIKVQNMDCRVVSIKEILLFKHICSPNCRYAMRELTVKVCMF